MTDNGNAWTTWVDFGGSTTTAPELARRPDGALMIFARTLNKEITLKYQI